MSSWISTRQRDWTDLERSTALNVIASVVVGDITIEPPAPTNTNMVAVNDTVAANFTIPAGSIRGRIANLGGDAPANITVNGQELAPGDTYDIGAVYVGDKLYLPPAYVVVANGSLWSYYYEK